LRAPALYPRLLRSEITDALVALSPGSQQSSVEELQDAIQSNPNNYDLYLKLTDVFRVFLANALARFARER
jgi:hypothetical protein